MEKRYNDGKMQELRIGARLNNRSGRNSTATLGRPLRRVQDPTT